MSNPAAPLVRPIGDGGMNTTQAKTIPRLASENKERTKLTFLWIVGGSASNSSLVIIIDGLSSSIGRWPSEEETRMLEELDPELRLRRQWSRWLRDEDGRLSTAARTLSGKRNSESISLSNS